MPPRRSRIRPSLFLAVAAVIAAIVTYIFGLSAYQASGTTLFEPRDLYVPRSIDVVVVMWCFWVGSSVGSFLNVVAWRMPRGESINGRSHCPRCLAQLKARDNFPVFGWLALGGRCRTCHLPISSRYPIVEGFVGLTLTLVSVAELYRLSLPHQFVHGHGGPFWAPVVDQPVLLTLFYHAVALAVCWAFGLIRMDSHRLPTRLLGFGLAATIVPMLVYPTLMVVPWQMNVDELWQPDGLYVDAWVRIMTAIAAATVLARYFAHGLCPAAELKLDPLGQSTARLVDLIAILCIPAIIVGWQALLAVTVIAAVVATSIGRWLPATCDSLGRFAIAMPFALTFQLVFWRRLHADGSSLADRDSGFFWASDGSSPWVILAWMAAVMLIPLWLRDGGREPLESTVQVDPQDDEQDIEQLDDTRESFEETPNIASDKATDS